MNSLSRILMAATATVAAAAPAHATEATEAESIKKALYAAFDGFERRDIDAANAIYLQTDRLVIYDVLPPADVNATGYGQLNDKKGAAPAAQWSGKETGFATLDKKVRQQLASTEGPIHYKIDDLDVTVDGNHAYSRYIAAMNGMIKGGKPFAFRFRTTDVWEKIDGQWKIVLEHSSAPPQ